MDTKSRQQPAALLPHPHTSHLRQSFWQIGIPLCVTVLLTVALAVLAALATAQDASQGVHWASIALIVLILPLYIVGLIAFVLIILTIYGIAKLYRVLPVYTLKARVLVYRIGDFTMENLNRLVQPAISVRVGWAGLQQMADLIRMRKTG